MKKLKKLIMLSFGLFLIVPSVMILSSCNTHAHEYASEWSYDEYYHWKDAECCPNVKTLFDNHNWQLDEDASSPATEEENGINVYKCTTCDKTKNEEVAKLKKTPTISLEKTLDKTYDGNAVEVLKSDIVTNSDGNITFSMTNYMGKQVTPINSGTYYLNVNIDETEAFKSHTEKIAFRIEQRELVCDTRYEFTGTNVVYATNIQGAVVGESPEIKIVFKSKDVGANVYSVEVSDNYRLNSEVRESLCIIKKVLPIKTYTFNHEYYYNKNLTQTSYVDQDDDNSLYGSVSISYTFENVNVGAKIVEGSIVFGSSNYDFSNITIDANIVKKEIKVSPMSFYLQFNGTDTINCSLDEATLDQWLSEEEKESILTLTFADKNAGAELVAVESQDELVNNNFSFVWSEIYREQYNLVGEEWLGRVTYDKDKTYNNATISYKLNSSRLDKTYEFTVTFSCGKSAGRYTTEERGGMIVNPDGILTIHSIVSDEIENFDFSACDFFFEIDQKEIELYLKDEYLFDNLRFGDEIPEANVSSYQLDSSYFESENIDIEITYYKIEDDESLTKLAGIEEVYNIGKYKMVITGYDDDYNYSIKNNIEKEFTIAEAE